ncbi:MAG: alpha/beta hydrolase [Burkholderiaceae bacterium]
MLLPAPPAYSAEFGNDQYNNGLRVASVGDILSRWNARSAAARDTLQVRLGIRYGHDASESIDLYEPKGATGPLPLLVFIHGGYWRSLSKAAFAWIAPGYVDRGIKVAVIDYGLAPSYPMETIVRQNLSAIAHLWLNAKALGIARDAIVVSGHSAGGHLTAMMMAARWPLYRAHLPTDVVRGGVAISGLYDMEPLRHTPYLNKDLELTPDRVAPLSPLYMSPATDAPLITAVGGDESDEFRRHNREIGIAWTKVLREDVPLPGCNHFTACEAFAEPGNRLFEATVDLCTKG